MGYTEMENDSFSNHPADDVHKVSGSRGHSDGSVGRLAEFFPPRLQDQIVMY